MIEVRALRKSYGGREVLSGVDLRIEQGRITGLAGPNGCGKTTLLKCLLGLAVPSSGEILVAGQHVDEGGQFRRLIGYMPQSADFPPNLRLGELLRMLEDLRGEQAAGKERLIDLFELRPALERPFGHLSGGTRQKLAAVTALMFDAPLIILDEPTAGLDPLSRVRFKDLLLAEAAAGKTILLVSHFMSEIEALASRLVFLSDGRVAHDGPVDGLIRETGEPDLERALTRLFLSRGGENA